MEIVDLQLHEPAPFEDWAGSDDQTRRRVMTEALWQSIDAVGVDAVILNPLEDPEWASELAHRLPDRIATVPMFHVRDADLADVEAHIVGLYGQAGTVAIRFSALPSHDRAGFDRYVAGGFDKAFAACEKLGVPIWLGVMGGAHSIDRVARAFPDLQIIVDHMALNQPPYQCRDDPPWKDLPIVLDLSRYENVAIKVCAPIALSDDPYPYADAWPFVARLLDAFGPERLCWASDIQRARGRHGYDSRLRTPATADASPQKWQRGERSPAPPPDGPDYPGKHTYMDSLAFFLYNDNLSQGDKEQILGQTARRLLKWPAAC